MKGISHEVTEFYGGLRRIYACDEQEPLMKKKKQVGNRKSLVRLLQPNGSITTTEESTVHVIFGHVDYSSIVRRFTSCTLARKILRRPCVFQRIDRKQLPTLTKEGQIICCTSETCVPSTVPEVLPMQHRAPTADSFGRPRKKGNLDDPAVPVRQNPKLLLHIFLRDSNKNRIQHFVGHALNTDGGWKLGQERQLKNATPESTQQLGNSTKHAMCISSFGLDGFTPKK